MTDGSRGLTAQNHGVSFYRHDAELIAEVARFVAVGLGRGERVLVIATAEHRDGLDEVLLHYGIDAVQTRVAGRYLTLDAAETLSKLMVHGAPDAAKFAHVIGAVIDAAAADGCAVRAFGEMVALLWAEGNVTAALRLESLWNELATTHPFSLLCGYPLASLDDGSLAEVTAVCELHSELSPPRSYASPDADLGCGGYSHPSVAVQESDVYVPVPAAVPAARRFVRSVLSSWGEDGLVSDAELIAAELSTNAVEHARSAFRIRLRRADGVLRIGVEDVGPAQPRQIMATDEALSGRGVAIVAQLAPRWGCEAVSGGKLVWAELASRSATKN